MATTLCLLAVTIATFNEAEAKPSHHHHLSYEAIPDHFDFAPPVLPAVPFHSHLQHTEHAHFVPPDAPPPLLTGTSLLSPAPLPLPAPARFLPPPPHLLPATVPITPAVRFLPAATSFLPPPAPVVPAPVVPAPIIPAPAPAPAPLLPAPFLSAHAHLLPAPAPAPIIPTAPAAATFISAAAAPYLPAPLPVTKVLPPVFEAIPFISSYRAIPGPKTTTHHISVGYAFPTAKLIAPVTSHAHLSLPHLHHHLHEKLHGHHDSLW